MTDLYVSDSEVSYDGKLLESEASANGCSIDEAAVKRADTVVLFGAGQGRIASRLLALRPRRLLVLEPVKEWADRAASYLPAGVQIFTNAPILRHALIERADERVALIGTPEYTEAFPAQFQATIALIQECEMHKQIRKNTRSRRYNTAILAGISNLPRVAEVPFWSDFGRDPMAGRPAVIVAAGPSLDQNRGLLRAAADAGAAIFAVNTSLPIAAAETHVDVATVIEALDSTEALAPHMRSVGLLALDYATNAAHFDLPGPKALFFPGVEPFTHLAAELGARVLPYGSSVATAAYSLAVHWGCSPIVMVGQDLAYTGGRAYARGLGPRSEIVAHDRGDHIQIEYPAEHLARFDRLGIPRPPERQVRIGMSAWGGQGSAFTTPDLLMFARWFEQAAVQVRGRGVRSINATEGGVRLEGFDEMTFAEAIASFGRADRTTFKIPRPRFSPADVDSMRRTIRLHVGRILASAVRGEIDALRERIMCSAFVDCLAAPDVSELKGDEPDFADRVCAAVRNACEDVLERV